MSIRLGEFWWNQMNKCLSIWFFHILNNGVGPSWLWRKERSICGHFVHLFLSHCLNRGAGATFVGLLDRLWIICSYLVGSLTHILPGLVSHPLQNYLSKRPILNSLNTLLRRVDSVESWLKTVKSQKASLEIYFFNYKFTRILPYHAKLYPLISKIIGEHDLPRL